MPTIKKLGLTINKLKEIIFQLKQIILKEKMIQEAVDRAWEKNRWT